MNTKEKPYSNRNRTQKKNEIETVKKAVEQYIEENEEILLAKEAMNRSQTIKERRLAPLLRRTPYLRIH